MNGNKNLVNKLSLDYPGKAGDFTENFYLGMIWTGDFRVVKETNDFDPQTRPFFDLLSQRQSDFSGAYNERVEIIVSARNQILHKLKL